MASTVARSFPGSACPALNGDALLFAFSDRIVREKLGLWREHKG